jgi:hypothetical protein
MAPALAGLVAFVGALFVVNDLGPCWSGCVFLGMFYVVPAPRAGSPPRAGCSRLSSPFYTWPGIDTGRVATRIRIWKDRWGNGLGHGHQVDEGCGRSRRGPTDRGCRRRTRRCHRRAGRPGAGTVHGQLGWRWSGSRCSA